MKRVVFILLALVLAFSVGIIGCTEQAPEPEVIVLHFYTMYPPTYVYTLDYYPAVFSQIEDESDEQIQIEIHWAQELGPTTEAHTIIGTGVADFGHVIPSYYPEQLPLSNMMGLPFAAQDPRMVQDAMRACLADPTVGDDLAAEWYAMNLVPMEFNPFVMPPSIWGKGETVTTVEELAGRKIFLTADVAAGDLLEAHDMTVIVSTMHEAYKALQTGLIDYMTITLTSVPAYNLHEVLDWGTTNTGFYCFPYGTSFNKDSWEALSTEHQDIILQAFYDHRYMMAEACLEGWAEAVDVIEDWGIDIYEWPQAEVDKLAEPAKQIWEDYINEWGCEEFAEAFVAALQDAGASPPWP